MTAGTSIAGLIFDLGGVVIDWNPRYVYRQIFRGDDAKMEHFLAEVCPQSWNEQQDAGNPIAAATEARVAQFPEWEAEIRAFYDRWIEMVGSPIPGTTELMQELKAAGYPLFALSNWSAELFPLVRYRVPAFDLFDRIFLSGEMKLIKPDPAIFEEVLKNVGVPRDRLLFIDDNPLNVAGAKNVWLKALRFINAQTLRTDLQARGVKLG